MKIKSLVLIILAGSIVLSCGRKVSPVFESDRSLESRVEKTLKGMTLEEKAGQMVQLTITVLEDETHEALDPKKLDEVFGEYKV